ncbi:MAG: class I SAM-dependent methyltransferase [Rhodospirillales bacterium]|nr:class I SAM-dependent methyltransferase [Rhodospirillales bacterium]
MPADSSKSDTARRHHRITEPSPWITRFAPLVPENGAVLDLACGNGRHGRIFLARGNPVVFIDRDVHAVANLAADPNAEVIEADLEDGGDWPFAGRRFAAILVSNYLHRPLFPHILDSIETGGVLIYETFARGNERFCRPRNPDHLLRAGELLERLDGRFHVVAYEHGLIESGPIPGVIQRVCAVHDRPADEETDPDPRPVLPRPA